MDSEPALQDPVAIALREHKMEITSRCQTLQRILHSIERSTHILYSLLASKSNPRVNILPDSNSTWQRPMTNSPHPQD